MIWAAVVVGKGGDYEVTQGKTVGLFVGLLVVHGILVRLSLIQSSTLTPHYQTSILTQPSILSFYMTNEQNCLATRWLARLTAGFVFINLGATVGAFNFPFKSFCHSTNVIH